MSRVLCCHFSSDGKLLATGGHDKKVVSWNAENLKQKSIPKEHTSLISDVRFSPSIPRLATSSFDKTIRVWDADKGASNQLRFQPRLGGYLATASDNVVSILDVETQACMRRFEGHAKHVDSLCWDPSGEYVVSVDEDTVKSLEVWDMLENRSMKIPTHDGLITSLAVTSSGMVASTGHDKYVKLWSSMLPIPSFLIVDL